MINLFRKKRASRLGLIPDKKDERDFIYKARLPMRELPESTLLKNISRFPWRYNQGSLGSCVGHGGMAEIYRAALIQNGQPDHAPSPLFGYWIAREDKKNDTGASIRDAFKAMNQFGLCSEKLWPYRPEKFADTPSPLAFQEALEHQAIRYERIYPVSQGAIMDALSQGYPVTFGMDLYSSFMSKETERTGVVRKPRKCREKFLGGHCLLIFDYDPEGVTILNSWGREWGDGGLCYVSWDHLLDSSLCRDFWVIYLTE